MTGQSTLFEYIYLGIPSKSPLSESVLLAPSTQEREACHRY